MARYAIIENSRVTNIVEAEEDFATSRGWVELTGSAGIGDSYADGQFIPYDPKADPVATAARANAVRAERNDKLVASDWTQTADVPQATKDKWAPYRQALRDVPQQAGFPWEVQWPDAP